MILLFVYGIALGVFFYGGLWLTVNHLAATRHPFALTFGSLMLRMCGTLAGFLLVLHGHWQNAAAVLIGFTAARWIVYRGRANASDA
jgi:F1F0 ATPase subunit 2